MKKNEKKIILVLNFKKLLCILLPVPSSFFFEK